MATKKLIKGIALKVSTKRKYRTSDGEVHTNAIIANKVQKNLNARENVRKFLIDQGLTFGSSPYMISTKQLSAKLTEPTFLHALRKAASTRKPRAKKRKAA